MTSNRIIITDSDRKQHIWTDGNRETFLGVIVYGNRVEYSTPILKSEDEAQKLLDEEWERINNEGRTQ